jgi:hypothetical protein
MGESIVGLLELKCCVFTYEAVLFSYLIYLQFEEVEQSFTLTRSAINKARGVIH